MCSLLKKRWVPKEPLDEWSVLPSIHARKWLILAISLLTIVPWWTPQISAFTKGEATCSKNRISLNSQHLGMDPAVYPLFRCTPLSVNAGIWNFSFFFHVLCTFPWPVELVLLPDEQVCLPLITHIILSKCSRILIAGLFQAIMSSLNFRHVEWRNNKHSSLIFSELGFGKTEQR